MHKSINFLSLYAADISNGGFIIEAFIRFLQYETDGDQDIVLGLERMLPLV